MKPQDAREDSAAVEHGTPQPISKSPAVTDVKEEEPRISNTERLGWADITPEDATDAELRLVHLISGYRPAWMSPKQWRLNMRACAKDIRAHVALEKKEAVADSVEVQKDTCTCEENDTCPLHGPDLWGKKDAVAESVDSPRQNDLLAEIYQWLHEPMTVLGAREYFHEKIGKLLGKEPVEYGE